MNNNFKGTPKERALKQVLFKICGLLEQHGKTVRSAKDWYNEAVTEASRIEKKLTKEQDLEERAKAYSSGKDW